MKFMFSARSKEQEDEDYLSLEKQNLCAEWEQTGGEGNPQSPYKVKIRIQNQAEQPWEGVILTELLAEKRNPAFFLPGFMYGSNRGDCPQSVPCEYPRMREGGLQRPSSSWWMVRGDRLSAPVALFFDCGRVTGLSVGSYWIVKDGKKKVWEKETEEAEFCQYAGYTCSLRSKEKDGTCSVGYTLGYENAPWLFIQSHQVKDRDEMGDNCFRLEAGEAVEFTVNVFSYPAQDETGIHEAIRQVYAQYHQKPRKGCSLKESVAEIAGAISRCAWLEEEKMYSGFVFQQADGSYTYNKLGSLTWTNGLSVAVPMLMAGIRLGQEKMRRQALACIENILANCWNPFSKLPYDAVSDGKWSIRGWWFDGMHTPGHSAYLTGQAMYYILKAYQFEKERAGCEHKEWLSFVRPVLAKVEQEKNSEYEYPCIFSEKTGAGLEYDAFGGVWCLAAGAYYAWLTGDTSFLEGLCKSEAHYYERYVRHVVCYGAPLDTDKAVDSEGILAYIRAVRYLHQMTKEEKYLKHMRAALDYEFSFKFCYNSPIQIPPLSRIGWSSCGGSITSTANPHIHPMSSTIVDEMVYYVRETQDSYVRNRMMDTVLWGCQTFNTYDGEYDYGEKGWMSERFCYSQGLVVQPYEDGSLASTWFALMPWAGGSVVEGLAGDAWDILGRGINGKNKLNLNRE